MREYDGDGGDDEYVREDGSFMFRIKVNDNHVSGTYYLDSIYFTDSSGNSINQDIASGGTGSPLLGLSFELTNPLYVEDTTAPTPTDLNVTVVEIDGEQWIEVTGNCTDVVDTWDNWSTLRFIFNAAEFPTSQ